MKTGQQYAAFDQINIGANLALDLGSLDLQTSVTCDANRMARCQYPATAFASNAEFIVYSPNASLPSLATAGGIPAVAIGIVTLSASLSGYVGKDANGYGYAPGDGWVYYNNAQLQYVGTATYGDVIGLLVDPANPSGPTLKVLKNGVVIGKPITIPASTAWYYAVSLGGTPGAYGVRVNPGNTQFRFPLTNLSGWWIARAPVLEIDLGTESYISLPTDNLPHKKFAGDVERIKAHCIVKRGVVFWPSRASGLSIHNSSAPTTTSSTTSNVEIHINDPLGKYNGLQTSVYRDQIVTLQRVAQLGSLNAAENVFVAIVDRVQSPTDQTKVIYCVDKLALLQQQLNRPLFPPTADASVAGKPRPMALGIVRTNAPTPYDLTNFLYAVHDGIIAAIGTERDRGKTMILGADFTMTQDGAGFDRMAAPNGRWTVETSSFGQQFTGTLVDALGGSGVFGSIANTGGGGGVNQPAGWTGGGGYPNDAASTCWQVTGASPNKYIFQVNKASGVYWLRRDVTAFSIGAGESYAFNIAVGQIPFIGTGADVNGNPIDIPAAKLTVTGTTGAYSNDANQTLVLFHAWATVTLDKANKTYGGTFTNPYSGAGYVGSSVTSLTTAGSGSLTFTTQAGLAFVVGSRVRLTSSSTGDWMEGAVTAYNVSTGSMTATMDRNSGTGTHADWSIDMRWALLLGFLANNEVTTTDGIALQSVTLNSIPAITANATLAGPGLDTMLKALYIDRGPLDTWDYDATGAQAIDAATGYQCGIRVTESETPRVQDVARPILDSFCADDYLTRDGKVSVCRLFAPEAINQITGLPEYTGVVSGTLKVTDFKSDVQPYDDDAPGLTTEMYYCRNWDQYTDSDFSGMSTSDVPLALREKLKRKFQGKVTSRVQVATCYAAAIGALPFESVFDLQSDAQKEIDRVCSIYAVKRRYFEVEVFSPIGRKFDIGQVWNVIDKNVAGLENGKQLLIRDIEDHTSEGYSLVTFWG